MIDATIIWDMDDEPDGNVQHIAEHGVTVDEVEERAEVRAGRKHSAGLRRTSSSRSSGRKSPTILG